MQYSTLPRAVKIIAVQTPEVGWTSSERGGEIFRTHVRKLVMILASSWFTNWILWQVNWHRISGFSWLFVKRYICRLSPLNQNTYQTSKQWVGTRRICRGAFRGGPVQLWCLGLFYTLLNLRLLKLSSVKEGGHFDSHRFRNVQNGSHAN